MSMITEAVVCNLQASIKSCDAINKKLNDLESYLIVAIRNPWIKPDQLKKIKKIKEEITNIREFCLTTLSKESE